MNSTMDQMDKRGAEQLEKRETVAPAVDVFENKDEILVYADLPGVAADTVNVSFDKGQITLGGKTESFDYARAFVVPNGIDGEKIEAKVEAGVLKVTLPKSQSVKPRQIPVRAG